MSFSNDDKRNTCESFSTAKRKVLLLHKGAVTDHGLIRQSTLSEGQLSF
jgi:hypothetical protein